jgi:hypothetical protein
VLHPIVAANARQKCGREREPTRPFFHQLLNLTEVAIACSIKQFGHRMLGSAEMKVAVLNVYDDERMTYV